MGGDEFLDSLIRLHIERCRKKLRQIDMALGDAHSAQARLLVMELRVCVQEVGAEEVVPLLRRFEQLLTEADEPATVRELMPELSGAIEQMERQLHAALAET